MHSNGYSLVRKLIEVSGADQRTMLAGQPLFDRLLTPTRIYVKSMLQLAGALPVSAFAHITGGGLTDNIPRVLPDGLEAHLHRASGTAIRCSNGWRPAATSSPPRCTAPSIAASA